MSEIQVVTYFLGKAEEDQLGQTRSSSEWRRNTLICLCWIDLPRRPHHAVSLCSDGAWYYIVAAQYKYCTLRTTESRQIIASHPKFPLSWNKVTPIYLQWAKQTPLSSRVPRSDPSRVRSYLPTLIVHSHKRGGHKCTNIHSEPTVVAYSSRAATIPLTPHR